MQNLATGLLKSMSLSLFRRKLQNFFFLTTFVRLITLYSDHFNVANLSPVSGCNDVNYVDYVKCPVTIYATV